MALLQGIAREGARAVEKSAPKLIEKSGAYHAVVKQLREVADKFGFKSEEFKALWNGASETHKIPGTEILADVNALRADKKPGTEILADVNALKADKKPAKIKAPVKEPAKAVKAATEKLPKVSRKPTAKPSEKLTPVAAAAGTGKKASPEIKKSDKTPAAKYRAQLRNISQMMNPDNEIPAEVLNATITDAAKVTGRTTEQVVADVAQFTKRNNILGESKYIEGPQSEVLRQSAIDAGVDPNLAARFKFEEQKYAPSRLNQGTEANTPTRTRQYRATIELTDEEKRSMGNTRFAGRDDRMVEKARATGKYTVSANTPEQAAKELAAFHQELKAVPEAPAHPPAVEVPPAEPAAALPARQEAPLESQKPAQVVVNEQPREVAEPPAEHGVDPAEELELQRKGQMTSDDLMEAEIAKQDQLPDDTARASSAPDGGSMGIPRKPQRPTVVGAERRPKGPTVIGAERWPKGTVDPKLAGTAAVAVGASALASRANDSGQGTSDALSIPAKNAPKSMSKEEQIAAEHNGPAPVPEITQSQTNRDVVKFVPTKNGNFPVYKKDSPSAVAFRAAFHAARVNGEKEFMFAGLKYSTNLA